MKEYIILYIILFLVAFPLAITMVLYIILNPIVRNKKLLGGVINYDSFMRKYLFRIDVTEEEFLRQLSTKNAFDVLSYNYYDDSKIIAFKKYNVDYKYKINIENEEGSIIVFLEQISVTSKVCFDINLFFIKKFNAIPIQFK